MKKATVTKQEAAARQLETAIKLYFENRDLISAYTLAAAANGILEGIWKNERSSIIKRQFDEGTEAKDIRFSMGEEWEIRFKDEYRKEGFRLLKASKNFFKHAELDHDREHEFASEDETGLEVFSAITNFRLIYGDSPPAMNTYLYWYMMVHPSILREDNPVLQAVKDGPGLDVAERFDHAELAAIGCENLERACPELFPPTDLQSHLRGVRSGITMKVPKAK